MYIEFFTWIGCLLVHFILSKFVYNLGLKINLLNQPPLYDVIQVNFPNLQSLRFIPEITHIIPIVLLVKLIIFNSYNKYYILKRFFKVHGILMLFRSLCFSGTLLPDSSQMCFESQHFGSCFDLMFSGHSTIMFLTSQMIKDYFTISQTVSNLLTLNNIVTCFLIIMCRNHYTVDVIVSLLLTYFVYHYFTGPVSGNFHQLNF